MWRVFKYLGETYFNNYLALESAPESLVNFLLGDSYFKIGDYNNAINQFEQLTNHGQIIDLELIKEDLLLYVEWVDVQ